MNPAIPIRSRHLILAAFVLLVASLLSTTVTAEKPKRTKQAGKESAISAMVSDYRSWKAVNAEPIAVPAKRSGMCAPGGAVDPNGPHAGGFVNVYVNPVGRDEYVGSQTPAFAAGTVIVKEKLTAKDSKGPHDLGVMIKRESGYAPDSSDWQYAFIDAKGNVTESQTKLTCAKCHQIQAESDYVFRRVQSTDADQDDNSQRSKSRKK